MDDERGNEQQAMNTELEERLYFIVGKIVVAKLLSDEELRVLCYGLGIKNVLGWEEA